MNNPFRLCFYFILICLSFKASSQENIKTITAQVLDKETFKPIAFASIYLKGQAIGTISNEEGHFVFHLPSDQKSNTIIISIIGYKSIEKNANTFTKDQKIFLSSKITQLDEVLITATKRKKLTAKEIVKKAYNEIENNYPLKPYITEGFIRDLQNEDGKYVEYLECAARFFNQGHKTKREPLVELVAVRTSYLADKHTWIGNSQRKNSIIDLIEDDFIRFDYGPIKGNKGWKYETDSILPYNGRLVYKISGTQKPFQKSSLYIDTETYAFVRMELTRSEHNGRSWTRRFTNGALQVYYNAVFEYQEYKGKMYLKYQKEEDIWKIYKGSESNELLFTKYPKKELFINRIIIDSLQAHPFKRNMDIGASIENQAKNHNQEFWSTYNIPQQTEKESKIILELKKMGN